MTVKVTEIYKADPTTHQPRPLVLARVDAGFPSPADDYLDGKLDLNEHIIKNPAATFFVRVQGDSMIGAGINTGDILVVDRSLEATDGSVVVAVIDGEFFVKRLSMEGKKLYLVADNDEYEQVEVKEEMDFRVWGVVTHTIHSHL